jgi:ribosomal protein L32
VETALTQAAEVLATQASKCSQLGKRPRTGKISSHCAPHREQSLLDAGRELKAVTAADASTNHLGQLAASICDPAFGEAGPVASPPDPRAGFREAMIL